MRIAILLMQKNESDLLMPWFEYHANLIGFENIYIYDNGSDNEDVLNDLSVIKNKGGHVYYEYNKQSDFPRKGSIISNKIKELDLKNPYDIYFPLDCDEFLACLDVNGNISIELKDIEYELQKYKNENRVLAIDSSYDSSPIHRNMYLRQLKQKKCFFVRDTCFKLDEGFHNGITKYSNERVKTKIVYIHYHFKSYEKYRISAKQKLIGRVNDFSRETLDEFTKNKGPGFHLTSVFSKTRSEYYAKFNEENRVFYDGFLKKLDDLGIEFKYFEEDAIINSDVSDNFVGYADSIVFNSDSIEVTGWCLNAKGETTSNIFVEVNGNFLDVKEIKHFPRKDVVAKRLGATLNCGFLLKVRKPNIFNENDLIKVKVKTNVGLNKLNQSDSFKKLWTDLLKKNKLNVDDYLSGPRKKLSFLSAEKCLILIDPQIIKSELSLKKEWANEFLNTNDFNERFINGERYLGLVAPEESFRVKNLLEDSSHIRAMYDRFCLGKDWDQTEYARLYYTWYLNAENGKYSNNSYEYFKKTRLKAWDAILDDMKKNGFKIPFNSMDNVEVAVKNESEIYLVDGRHRLYMAQILKLPAIPVCVNILTESAIEFVSKNTLDLNKNKFSYISSGSIDSVFIEETEIYFSGWAIDENMNLPNKFILSVENRDFIIDSFETNHRPDVMKFFKINRDDYGFRFKIQDLDNSIKNFISSGDFIVRMENGKLISEKFNKKI